MLTIIGLKKSVGDMVDQRSGQQFHYDNIKFFVVDDQNVSGIGECPDVISVKSSLCDGIYESGSIGKHVIFSYNKYGRVQSVEIIS